MISVVGCTVGVLVIVQPWKSFQQGFTPDVMVINESIHQSQETENNSRGINTAVLPGYIAVISAGAVSSIYFYITAFYLKSIPSAIQCLVAGSFCLPSSLLISFYVEQPVIITNVRTIILATGHALGTGIHMITQNSSLQLLDPVIVSILFNFHAVLGLIPQYTFIRQYLFGRMNIMEVSGCIVVFVFVSIGSFLSKGPVHEDLKS